MDIKEIVKQKNLEIDGNMLDLIENKSILPKQSKQDIIDNTLARSIELIVQQLSDITEFNPKDLMPLSMYKHDKYINRHLHYFEKNKKHYKRKHSKELIEALEKISSMIRIGNDIDYEQLGQRFSRR